MASNVDSSGLSVISEERTSARKYHSGNDNCDNVYNNKTKNPHGGGHKKKLHPLMLGPIRQNPGKLVSLHAASKNNLSEFTQRIMSAKLLRVKQVQNQLNEAQNQLSELINENRVLKNLLKRQEGALKRYEGNHAELPQLIRSHNEEIRTLKASNKLIKSQLRESNTKLKERENELEALRDNYNKLKKLSTEKNLLEREKLQKKVEDLQDVIKEQEDKIQVLSRKVLLESKNYRHHLNIEVIKHKETQKDLSSALSMINKLESQLTAKEKPLSNGKILLKRDNKNLMPVIVNKSTDIQPKIGVSEDSFLNRDDGKRKSEISNSPDSELELLSGIGSSDDTPSPTQDIFPDINKFKKCNQKIKTMTEITPTKSEMYQLHTDQGGKHLGSLKPRNSPLPKMNQHFSTDLETNAKLVTEKLNADLKAIDYLAQKVDSSTSSSENKNRLNSLTEEVNLSASVLENEVNNELSKNIESQITKIDTKAMESESKRSVPKRKFVEEKEAKENTSDFNIQEELTEFDQEKSENMAKTWNNLKKKIQEERKKAEEKIKELKNINASQNNSDSISSDVDSEENEEPTANAELKSISQKDLRYVNFTDDAYILHELEKTDKIFNKLKNEKQKFSFKSKSTSSSADKKSKIPNLNMNPNTKPQPEIKSFRTESQREHKCLIEFQSEYQKENLLKALKAIDVGKNSHLSTEESEESDSEKKKEKSCHKNGLTHIRKFPSESSGKELMAELFGKRYETGNMKLEYGTVGSLNE